ncbi:MAG: 30S ribosomal protein S11 [Candidatus Portnoybacteria bacterium CG10_big_fil_rev_8_21_14_0_10_44_7]|uniref:Small ribosomal subunit protein uS11 n=1 Tax=Candidatus Portnoybacteria bacterium CG10_big_fil_rev_8_21_14_0_10_44_7 TaxID=1974816 RepID=A0A2M8KJA1_9BACT|nr:MAG: 30S ribosomal protein S11 [Candidatus Portnoybacteria bacterium CG10_big_fil_rev_8_21_14_0_10_44_7]
MGKKKIQTQTAEEAIKETEALEAAQKKVANKAAQKTAAKRFDRAQVFVKSTYNNTIISVARPGGEVVAWGSAGALGFKGPKKATPFAATKIVESLMEKISRFGVKEVEVFVKGIGSGREAAVRALAAAGLEISFIKDQTPIPHNGCRPKKPRRV